MLGPRAGAFTDENIPDEVDDEDLRDDPVSKMDMTVSSAFHTLFFFTCVSSVGTQCWHCFMSGLDCIAVADVNQPLFFRDISSRSLKNVLRGI